MPTAVSLTGFADANNHAVWDEPSFLKDGTMFFVRFETSAPGWQAEILSSVRQADGTYGRPQKAVFRTER